MFERFTSGARAVVDLAQAEARSLRHGYIGTEHRARSDDLRCSVLSALGKVA